MRQSCRVRFVFIKHCLAIAALYLTAIATGLAQTASLSANRTTLSIDGGTITFTATLTFTGSQVVSLDVTSVPDGWAFVSVAGRVPTIAPSAGEGGPFGFSYIDAQSSPVTFTFVVSYPAGTTAAKTVGGITASFRPDDSVTTVQLSAVNFSAPPPPTINSASKVTAAAGQPFNYSISASGSPTSYAATGLPSWLSLNSTTGVISGTAPASGSASFTVTATNAVGTSSSHGVTVTIADAPTISTHPQNQATSVGGSFTLSVTASGASSYQWRKDGNAISGATGSSYTKSNVAQGDAGSYTVVVSNAVASVTSNAATVTVSPPNSAPSISSHPTSLTAGAGSPATFTVAAAGTGPLSYQWRRNSQSISGATNTSYTVVHAWNDTAGEYSATVTNSLGAVTSNAGVLSVKPVEYFGSFANNGGTFALYVRPDRTGVFLAFARGSKVALVTKDLVFDLDGRFSVTTRSASGSVAGSEPRAMSTGAEYTIEGTIGADGALSGSIGGLGLSMTAPAPSLTGPTMSVAGFYQSGASGSSATSYTIIGPDGDAYVATVTAAGADAGKGTVDSSGNMSVTTESAVAVTGRIDGGATITIRTTPPGSTTPVDFTGGNPETRVSTEKLINVSTRAIAGSGDTTLIVGFSVTGAVNKRVLVRGVGPTLKQWVPTALSNPQLKLYAGQTMIAENAGWSTAANATEISSAGAAAGAFPLLAGSKDAALLVYVAPGTYTAQVSSTDGATGVALVEVYEVQ